MPSVILGIATLILAMEVVMADNDQCADFQFKSPFLPGESCEGIYNKNPESQTKSGYYWILSREYCEMTYTGSSCEDIYSKCPETFEKSGYYRVNDKWIYCNMKEITSTKVTTSTTVSPISVTSLPTVSPTPDTNNNNFIPTCAGVGGGWRRIAQMDTNSGDYCPGEWQILTHSGFIFCHKVSSLGKTCSSTYFSTNGTSYQRVCGRARGYQKGYTVGFIAEHNTYKGIDGWYADGLQISYGSPRQHIWSYVAGVFDNRTHNSNCPCADGGGRAPPTFVGTHYYCESGNDEKGGKRLPFQ